jgi:hypothetical protein
MRMSAFGLKLDDYVDTNPLNALADEPVTPREMGYTDVPPRHCPWESSMI